VSEKNLLSGLFSRLASLEVALAFLLLIGLAAIPGTFVDNRHAYYGSGAFILLLAGFSANLIICTIHRWRRLATSVLVVHLGILLTIAGFVVRELTGTVATINVYEGEPANKFYLPYSEVDIDLGFSLQVHKIHTEYYPVPVRIGVMKGAEKISLHTTKTGDEFTVPGYRVVVDKFISLDHAVKLFVYDGKRLIGNIEVKDTSDPLAGFPFTFRLVAFQTPQIRRSWVDLELTRPNQAPLKGESEINRPLSLHGYEFYYVQSAYDDNGRIYAGIQIVKDPGRPFTFLGMAVAALGALMAAYRRLHGTG
jgi:cytochrome c biogenesis protein ResB